MNHSQPNPKAPDEHMACRIAHEVDNFLYAWRMNRIPEARQAMGILYQFGIELRVVPGLPRVERGDDA